MDTNYFIWTLVIIALVGMSFVAGFLVGRRYEQTVGVVNKILNIK